MINVTSKVNLTERLALYIQKMVKKLLKVAKKYTKHSVEQHKALTLKLSNMKFIK